METGQEPEQSFLVLKHIVEIDRWSHNEANTVLPRFAYFRSTAIDAELNCRSTAMKLDYEYRGSNE